MKYGAYRRFILLATVSLLAAAHALAAYVGTNNTVIPALPPLVTSNGFLFVDNEYVDAPYCISNHDCRIFINGKLVHEMIIPAPPLVVTNLPELPPGITSTTSLCDATFEDFRARAEVYHETLYPGPNECVPHIIAFYASLPNVSNAAPDPACPECIVIQMNNGEHIQQAVGISEPEEYFDAVEEMSSRMNLYFRRLDYGSIVLLTMTSDFVLASDTETKLVPLLLLRDKKEAVADPQERIQLQIERGKQAGAHFFEDVNPNLLTNLVASPQLEQRIQELLAKEQVPEE